VMVAEELEDLIVVVLLQVVLQILEVVVVE
jgi:hypothetical protein